ncbi:hypothetical protein MMC13_002076, partial [Lambiella insularis]|nr:hypothetical protein [Lambiella insularis]
LNTPDGQSKKRKYRHRPKPDGNAPPNPLTAYVSFAKEYREGLTKERSFTDIAKDVGRAWRALPDNERSRREQEADKQRKIYHETLREYKLTDNYWQYMRYLKHFKDKEGRGAEEEIVPHASSKGARYEGSISSSTGADNLLVGTSNQSETLTPKASKNENRSDSVTTARTILRELLYFLKFNADEPNTIRLIFNAAIARHIAGSKIVLVKLEHQQLV